MSAATSDYTVPFPQDICMPAMRAQASAVYVGVITIVASTGPVIVSNGCCVNYTSSFASIHQICEPIMLAAMKFALPMFLVRHLLVVH